MRGVRSREGECAEEKDQGAERGEEVGGEGEDGKFCYARDGGGRRARGAFCDEFCVELRELFGACFDEAGHLAAVLLCVFERNQRVEAFYCVFVNVELAGLRSP